MSAPTTSAVARCIGTGRAIALALVGAGVRAGVVTFGWVWARGERA